MKKLIALASLTLALVGCSQTAQEKQTDEVSIGVNQFMEHESLTQAYEGFIDELAEQGYQEGENLHIEYKNAQGDQSNLQSIAQQLAGQHDLILNIATPSAQSMANADQQTPQLFTAVTDPVEAKLVESLDHPAGQITGTSDRADTAQLVDLLLKADPAIKCIGIIYNSSEINSEIQYQQAKEEIESRGLQVESAAVSSTNDVQSAISALADQVDGIYIPTDNTMASAISTIGQVLMEKQISSVAAFGAGIEGSLATYGVDYEVLGRQTAQQAVQIIEGQSPADMPVQLAEKVEVQVNEDMAQALNIDPARLKED